MATGAPLPDEIHWCKFSSVAWTKDGAGFFYAKYPPPSSKGKDDGAGTETEAAASQKVGGGFIRVCVYASMMRVTRRAASSS